MFDPRFFLSDLKRVFLQIDVTKYLLTTASSVKYSLVDIEMAIAGGATTTGSNAIQHAQWLASFIDGNEIDACRISK